MARIRKARPKARARQTFPAPLVAFADTFAENGEDLTAAAVRWGAARLAWMYAHPGAESPADVVRGNWEAKRFASGVPVRVVGAAFELGNVRP